MTAAEAGETHPRAGDRSVGALLFAAMCAAYLTTAGGSLATSDAVVTYDVTRQMVEHHTVALSADLVGNDAYRGADGRFYSPFGILQALWNIPFYLAGRVGYSALPAHTINEELATKAAVALGNSVTAALVVWLVWRLAGLTTSNARVALAAALAAGFGTSLWPYSKFGFNVPLSALLVTAVVYFSLGAIRTGRGRAAWLAGTMCGFALLTRHEFAMLACSSVAAIGWYRRRDALRAVSLWALGAVPGFLVWASYNATRYGSPFETGYLKDQTLGMGGSLLGGLWGQMASPGASVFLYAPAMLLASVAVVAIRRREPALASLVGGATLLFALFYAQLDSWAGGRSYGPRYLVPFMPLMCVPLAAWFGDGRRTLRALAVAVCVLSGLVQLPGVLVDFAKVRVEFARAANVTYETRLHAWSTSPLALNLSASVEAVPRVARHMMGGDPKPAVIRGDAGQARDFSQQFAFSLDFWWIYLFYLGVVPAWMSLVMGATLGLAAFGLWVAAWRRATALSPLSAASRARVS